MIVWILHIWAHALAHGMCMTPFFYFSYMPSKEGVIYHIEGELLTCLLGFSKNK